MSPDEQIQIQLVSVPMYGILTRSQSQQEHEELREYSSFTMEDINKLKIRFETLTHCSVSIVLPSVLQQLISIFCSSNMLLQKMF